MVIRQPSDLGNPPVEDGVSQLVTRRSLLFVLGVGLPAGSAVAAHLLRDRPDPDASVRALRTKGPKGVAVNVVDFGADPTGVRTDTAQAFKKALSVSRTLHIPNGTYNFGDASGGVLCDLSAAGDGITFDCGEDVTFVCRTVRAEVSAFFGLKDNSNFTCGAVRFRDHGYDHLVQNFGAVGIQLAGGTRPWGNVHIHSIHAENCTAPIEIVGPHPVNRVRGVTIGSIVADDCYYGFLAADQGDGVRIGRIDARQCYRAYFVYGATGHSVKIFNQNPRVSSGSVNICRMSGGFDTRDITVDYVARNVTVDTCHVLINQIGLGDGVISDVRVKVDIQGSVPYSPVRFVNYEKSRGHETDLASKGDVYGVEISGVCDARARAVEAVASYAHKGAIVFEKGPFLKPAQSLLNAFSFANPQ